MQDALRKTEDLKAQLSSQTAANGTIGNAITAFSQKLDAVIGSDSGGGGRGGGRGRGAGPAPGGAPDTLAAAAAGLAGVSTSLQAADVAPTANQLAAIASARESAGRAIARWNTIKGVDLPAINVKLKAAGMQPLVLR